MRNIQRDGGTDRNLNNVNIAIFFLIGIFNAITGITGYKSISYYLTTVIPFFVFALLVYKIGGNKTNAVIFAIIGILSTLLGVEDNATGAIFLIYSFYIFHTTKSNIIIICITLIAIVCKFMFLNFTISQAINMILAYIYIFAIYYILIHPKSDNKNSVICPDLDAETLNILQNLYQGYIPKEIAEMVYLSEAAVSKRIGRAKITMNAKSTVHLLAICRELGYIGLKVDM